MEIRKFILLQAPSEIYFGRGLLTFKVEQLEYTLSLFSFFLTYNMQNFLWKEIFLRVFYCLRAGAAKPENFTYFCITVFIFFQHIKYIQKGGYADAEKRRFKQTYCRTPKDEAQ